ncbi:unnamed protein product [Rotaria socialis]|uniref:Uncharacterized protein n=1 Tax=Rotaria socialis TaxID=392032 RepID=A0A817UYI1_9BILA|nr:unnamed protein product [Rotaria socialis]
MVSTTDMLELLVVLLTMTGIVESVGNASHKLGTVFLITFGNGSNLDSNKTPSDFNFTTNHSQQHTDSIESGNFGFVNKIAKNRSSWHIGALDHTKDDDGGYMFLVDVGNESHQPLFNYKVDNLSRGVCYEFSAYITNVVKSGAKQAKSNVRLEIRETDKNDTLITQTSTGDLPECSNMSWSKYGISFVPTSTSAALLVVSNVYETMGNDLAIDDIELRVCSDSVDQCAEQDTQESTSMFLITFGEGSSTYSNKTPSDFNFTTNHTQNLSTPTEFGHFGLVNKVPGNVGTWHNDSLDHTVNDNGGYMFLVDVGEDIHQPLFSYKIINLCIGLCYEFSAYFANVVIAGRKYAKPDVRLEVRATKEDGNLIANRSTGDIPECNNMTWSKHSISFSPTSSLVVLLMLSNVNQQNGNDLAIDDIELRVCSRNHSGFCPPKTSTTSAATVSTATSSPASTSTTTTTTSTSSTTTQHSKCRRKRSYFLN